MLSLACAALSACSAVVGLPPVVSYTTPAENSGNVPYASTISAVFSRPMNPATITAASFTVSIGEVPVAGTVSCSGDTATFAPSSLLPGNSIVTATVTTAAKDVNGTALAADRTWSFMTVTTPAVPALSAGSVVLYYAYTFDVNPWTRSLSPVSMTNGANVVSQACSPVDGSVTLTITNAPGYEDNGFYFYVGELRYLSTISVVAAPGSGPYGSNIYLDTDGDGKFFSWVGNVYSPGGADQYYAGPSSVGDILTIDSTSSFGGHTLAQLKAGLVAGVTGTTRAAIYLGSSVGAGQSWTATIQTVKVN